MTPLGQTVNKVSRQVERPLRILAPHVGCNVALGGGRYDFEQLASLDRLKHKIRILAPRSRRGDAEFPLGLEVKWIGGRAVRYAMTWNAIFALPLLQHCIRWKPDIIRVHSPYTLGIAALFAARVSGVPAVAIVHHLGDPIPGAQWVERAVLPRFRGVLCVSEATARALSECGVPLTRIGVSSCGLGAEYVPNPHADRGPAFDDDPARQYLLFVGNLIKRKNLEWLIGQVYVSYCNEGGAARLIIVGDGPCRQALAECAQKAGIADRVQFLGRVGHSQKLALLRGASAFLFPSEMEGFGLAAVEAMGCGVPTITSDRGALPELVRHGVTGFVLPLDQGPRIWSEYLHRLMGDRQLRAAIGASASVDVHRRFSWERNAAEAAKFFARLAG